MGAAKERETQERAAEVRAPSWLSEWDDRYVKAEVLALLNRKTPRHLSLKPLKDGGLRSVKLDVCAREVRQILLEDVQLLQSQRLKENSCAEALNYEDKAILKVVRTEAKNF